MEDRRNETTGFAEHLQGQLIRTVLERVQFGIRELAIEVGSDGIVIYGRTTTYYAKQLAQQAALELGPFERLENRIVVDSPSVFA